MLNALRQPVQGNYLCHAVTETMPSISRRALGTVSTWFKQTLVLVFVLVPVLFTSAQVF